MIRSTDQGNENQLPSLAAMFSGIMVGEFEFFLKNAINVFSPTFDALTRTVDERAVFFTEREIVEHTEI